MARRLIGTATTNSQGIATIEYTGTGAGKLQIIATSGDLTSETYQLTDALFLDNGTSETTITGTVNEHWYTRSGVASGTVTAGTTGTLIDGTNGQHAIYSYPSDETVTSLATARVYTAPYKGEFDLVNVTGTCYVAQNGTNGDQNRTIIDQIGAEDGDHISFWNDGTKLYYQVNDETPTTYTPSSTNTTCAVGLRVASGGKLTFKNFMIYPI